MFAQGFFLHCTNACALPNKDVGLVYICIVQNHDWPLAWCLSKTCDENQYDEKIMRWCFLNITLETYFFEIVTTLVLPTFQLYSPHNVWNSLKMPHLNFSILTFSTKIDLLVWEHCLTASFRFSKSLQNWPILGHF